MEGERGWREREGGGRGGGGGGGGGGKRRKEEKGEGKEVGKTNKTMDI